MKIEEEKITNILQAFNKMKKDNKDIVLICTYYNRKETHVFNAFYYNVNKRYIDFKHKVNCIKRDFRDISTYYRGNKKDCKFKWVLKEKIPV